MTSRRPFRRPIFLAVALVLGAAFSASPARADRCDDSAKELTNNIDKLKVVFKARNTVYMSHPLAKELSVACRGDKYSIELYAKGERKPKPEFFNLVGSMAAVVFTIPKDDAMTGSSRCLKRMGILRGDKVTMRYRRLNMECQRTKTEASIAINPHWTLAGGFGYDFVSGTLTSDFVRLIYECDYAALTLTFEETRDPGVPGVERTILFGFELRTLGDFDIARRNN